jgi:hypothetical protein
MRKYEKRHEHAEQEQRQRRHELRALAMDIAARQLARAPREQRQRRGDLALEVEDAMREVVADRAQRAVDMRRLAAGVAMRADQRRPAIRACRAAHRPPPLAVSRSPC